MTSEFSLRGSADRAFRLVIDGAQLARVYEDPAQRVIAGPAGIQERTAGQPAYTLTIRAAEDSQATVYVNTRALFPTPSNVSGLNNQQPASMRFSGSGPAGGTVNITGIRAFAAD